MNSNMQCPICGSTNNIILENNSQKILKLRHLWLLFSNKELANKFNTRCLCPKCNLEFKYNEVTGYSIDSTKKMEFGILSALWQYIAIKLCYSDSIDNLFIDKDSRNLFIKFLFDKYSIRLNESDLLVRYKSKNINKVGDLVSYIKSLKIE